MKLLSDTLETPIGAVRIVALEGELVFVDFADNAARMEALLAKRFGTFTLLEANNPFGFTEKLGRYFQGNLEAVRDLAVSTGGSAFQQSVWGTLGQIPAGETWSYAQLARRIGNPAAVRAVGATNGLNPISIVLPCHRVIGSSGALTGYAGGLQRKKWLLEHELKFAVSSQTALFA